MSSDTTTGHWQIQSVIWLLYWSPFDTCTCGHLQQTPRRKRGMFYSLSTIPTIHNFAIEIIQITMMFSFTTSRFVLLMAAACIVLTSAEPTVELGFAEDYAILAKTGISINPAGSTIKGDIAVSPIAATAMTGFSLILDPLGQFATSSLVSETDEHPGRAYSASYGGPVAALLTTAVGAMETAYTDAAGRTNPDAARINLGGGHLGGNFGGSESPLTPGVYTFGTDVTLESDVTFSGDGVFIIQMTGSLVQPVNINVILTNGATAKNIFWQVAGLVTVGTGAHMEGILLVATSVAFGAGSSLNGRVLTQTACTLGAGTTIDESSLIARRRGLRSR